MKHFCIFLPISVQGKAAIVFLKKNYHQFLKFFFLACAFGKDRKKHECDDNIRWKRAPTISLYEYLNNIIIVFACNAMCHSFYVFELHKPNLRKKILRRKTRKITDFRKKILFTAVSHHNFLKSVWFYHEYLDFFFFHFCIKTIQNWQKQISLESQIHVLY